MNSQFVATVGSIVAILGLLSTWTAGVWFLSGLDNRIATLEADEEWKSKIERQVELHEDRWGAHYGLYGDLIKKRGEETGVNTDVLEPRTGGLRR